jgi:cation transport regulator ChaC
MSHLLEREGVYKTAYLPEDLSKFLFHRNRGGIVVFVMSKKAAKKKRPEQKQKPQSRISSILANP